MNSNNQTIKQSNNYLVWLEWPEKCFRVDAEALRYLKSVVPKGGRVVRVRSEEAFLRALPKATHAIVWEFKPEWFEKAPRLRMLATPAAGQELVPTEGPKGVKIHFGHYHGQIIAESVLGFMLCWAKGFFAVGRAPSACRAWPRAWLSGKCFDVAGTKAVIVGYGHVGRAIGAKLMALGVRVVGVTRHGIFRGEAESFPLQNKDGSSTRSGKDSASPLLKDADWLILALPSTTGTDNYLDAKLIRGLPRRCVVINVGRGNAVDERALVAALRSGRLAGAYLDVCRREHSEIWSKSKDARRTGVIDPARRNVPTLVLMPHSAAFSPAYIVRSFEELKDDGCL